MLAVKVIFPMCSDMKIFCNKISLHKFHFKQSYNELRCIHLVNFWHMFPNLLTTSSIFKGQTQFIASLNKLYYWRVALDTVRQVLSNILLHNSIYFLIKWFSLNDFRWVWHFSIYLIITVIFAIFKGFWLKKKWIFWRNFYV